MKMSKLKKIYDEKYAGIPDDYESQLNYISSNKHVDWKKVESEKQRIENMQWKTIEFSFPIIPYPCPRPRSTQNGFFYVEGAHDHWLYMQDKVDAEKIISTAVRFEVTSYMPIPSSMTGTEMMLAQMGYINPYSGGDWDNLGKTYSDALQMILIINDNIIIDGRSIKKYCIKPRVDIKIEYQEDYDSKYNRRKMESSKSYKKIFES